MTVEDAIQAAEIEKNIFSVPWSENAFIDAISQENNIYLAAKEEGKVVGYVGMWCVLGEGNITNVAVAEEYRGKHIASALMEELERIGREKGTDIFFLEVRESNQAAISLYEKCGYRYIGIRRNFYEHPVENARIMSKTFFDNNSH